MSRMINSRLKSPSLSSGSFSPIPSESYAEELERHLLNDMDPDDRWKMMAMGCPASEKGRRRSSNKGADHWNRDGGNSERWGRGGIR